MGRIDDRLAELGLELPRPFAAPPGVEFKFLPVRIQGNLGWVSGHGPMDGDRPLVRGKVGAEISPDRACQAAAETALSIIASLNERFRSLDSVTKWLKATVFVNCAPGFSGMPAVANGFSALVNDVWGEDNGVHARSAIGVAELPFDWPVEIEAVIKYV